ncbi:MAG: hypothetical protein JJT76_14670 [Clostridiaceae bacterium]|nr:hypothetical protein [Clostridiaceae bacterium]
MGYIQFGVAMMVLLFVFTAIIGIWMKVTNMIGEKLGIGEFLLNLCKNKSRDNK